ncbi:MAG: hypothetical protein A2Z96_06235 [Spirochaetes bacterium GWB1_48_6]|nr:MAG: hypothetical protein A2Z96_06235 [Spirochaetes bacterium GWB1_48_6]
MPAVHFKVYGQVQGVGFRYFVLEKAKHFHLKGWIMNHPEGSVEGVLQGSPDEVSSVLSFIAKGPPGAFVTSIKEKTIPENPGLSQFSIKSQL